MPKYQMIFDTKEGEAFFTVDIDQDESLDGVLTEILADLHDKGRILRGWQDGVGEVVCKWEGRELRKTRPLPEQQVKPNDILRVGIAVPPLQVRRDEDFFDITRRVELREGDDIFVGRTILRFHLKRQQQTVNKSHTFIQRVQQGRSFQQTVYYMALIGGLAGLACWFLASLLSLTDWTESWALDFVNYALLGGFIGGLTVGFNDRWLGDRVVPRWILSGVVVGILAGFAGGAMARWLRTPLEGREWLFRVLAWMVTGALIGFGISLRWWNSNKARVVQGLLGGLLGGALGGLAYWTLTERIGELAQALGMILTGTGITLGVSLAPILLRHGVLQFINSRDPSVIRKYAQARKQWELHEGGKYVIGSESARHSMTLLGPDVQIYLPDQQVAPKHAILLSRDQKYFIEPHPERAVF